MFASSLTRAAEDRPLAAPATRRFVAPGGGIGGERWQPKRIAIAPAISTISIWVALEIPTRSPRCFPVSIRERSAPSDPQRQGLLQSKLRHYRTATSLVRDSRDRKS